MNAEKLVDHIVSWLKQYADRAGMRGFIVGISGGVDSACVSHLAARTGKRTLLLEMPIHQKQDEIERSSAHSNALKSQFPNVESLKLDLGPVFDLFRESLGGERKDCQNQTLALANSRSRLRMLTLYYYAQVNRLLVAGTGNKVEDFGIGFFTKYGDGGVDISPIGDLLKSEVYELAKHLGVIESIQKAAPTDGLWDHQKTDEEQIGASYPELEWAMGVYEEHGYDDFEGRQREVFVIYDRLRRSNLHKMNPIPVCKIPQNLLLDRRL